MIAPGTAYAGRRRFNMATDLFIMFVAGIIVTISIPIILLLFLSFRRMEEHNQRFNDFLKDLIDSNRDEEYGRKKDND